MSNLQIGQEVDRVRSHLSMHSVWKKCRHGMVLTFSSCS